MGKGGQDEEGRNVFITRRKKGRGKRRDYKLKLTTTCCRIYILDGTIRERIKCLKEVMMSENNKNNSGILPERSRNMLKVQGLRQE